VLDLESGRNSEDRISNLEPGQFIFALIVVSVPRVGAAQSTSPIAALRFLARRPLSRVMRIPLWPPVPGKVQSSGCVAIQTEECWIRQTVEDGEHVLILGS